MSSSSHSHPKTQTETDVCAWCKRKVGRRSYKVRGVPASNYGMCADCLSVQRARLLFRPS